MDAEIDVSPLPVLLFWADALNASREDVRDLITRARHGLESGDAIPDPIARKRKLDLSWCAKRKSYVVSVTLYWARISPMRPPVANSLKGFSTRKSTKTGCREQ
jgi:hypothetical protein